MKCEKCGKELSLINVNVFNYDGTDQSLSHSYNEYYKDAVVIDTTPNWTGYELSEEEMMETITCPHCGKFPFIDKEIHVDDFHEEETEDVRFCPQCGRPLNEQAWKELERRINYVNQKLLPKNGVGINEWVEMTERKNNYEEHEH